MIELRATARRNACRHGMKAFIAVVVVAQLVAIRPAWP
jgi:hypothetical protein